MKNEKFLYIDKRKYKEENYICMVEFLSRYITHDILKIQ